MRFEELMLHLQYEGDSGAQRPGLVLLCCAFVHSGTLAHYSASCISLSYLQHEDDTRVHIVMLMIKMSNVFSTLKSTQHRVNAMLHTRRHHHANAPCRRIAAMVTTR